MMANPKTIGICIFLFLASALITLSIKQTHHKIQFLPTHHKGVKAVTTTQQQILKTHKVAYATFLAANANPSQKETDEESAAIDDADDGYFVSTRVLAYTLLHSKSAGSNNSIDFLVLCTRDVSKRKRDRLKQDGATIILVEKLKSDWVNTGIARWADMLAKLRLFQLTDYAKICYIDADTLVTGPLDGVFFDEATLTQATLPNPAEIKDDESPLPRTYMFAAHADYWGYDHPFPPPADMNYLNCGFFVLTPSLMLFDYYMSVLNIPGRFDPGFMEQNLLNYAHRREGNMPWKPLWYGWNVNWATEKDWRGGGRSFHAKFWDSDPSHDPVLKGLWKEKRAEMEGFFRGRDGL
ncbi:glycosyltransferase family 8 protein [Zasmidium cellare ATCC 36951]|uniref:Glycosyltransferase family 8 protein n=1 Tax=Zasmidium cellare ATCC 36951 TaxID=1080233 RepID=A0A6A6CPD6_ZASCE|nr:glycosyltransferase family 8 protein [Zasmidium cellare ATCC 36951]KAF2168994.1 glycosyltransferase family 8 protein [Zasmidium cellare ATCC 36951]